MTGMCGCGCGGETTVARMTNSALGHVKGQPVRFLRGHAARLQTASSIREHFWDHLDMSGGPEACWPWLRATDINGYGRVPNVTGRGNRYPAHRLAFELHHQVCVVPGYHTCHHCDNRPCCNPGHLFLGTAADNSADMARKGRNRVPHVATTGEKNPAAKVTALQVEEIRLRYSRGSVFQRELAAEFGLTQTMVSKIVRRDNWAERRPA